MLGNAKVLLGSGCLLYFRLLTALAEAQGEVEDEAHDVHESGKDFFTSFGGDQIGTF